MPFYNGIKSYDYYAYSLEMEVEITTESNNKFLYCIESDCNTVAMLDAKDLFVKQYPKEQIAKIEVIRERKVF